MRNQNRINFLKENIEEHRALISNSESLVLEAKDQIEETQRVIEDLREFIGNQYNDINEMESELEVLREEQQKRSQGVQDAEDRDWHGMKL